MFGDPLGALKSSLMEDLKPSEETLKLLELVLDHIRANLANIRKTWGPESIQYKSATEIMDQYLEENAKRLKVQKPNLEDLMQNMNFWRAEQAAGNILRSIQAIQATLVFLLCPTGLSLDKRSSQSPPLPKKELIKALVSVHLTNRRNADVIEDKGNGLIILLHGSPGTGKTLTAETVAEIAEKPLYRVTCEGIGTDAETVEKYLDSVLLIGITWECVVLVDETDVFLEERQVSDLKRNALVSVFLRILEYYDGILILTSNRVGTFDEAFKSRVQLAVHYPALDADGRSDIWQNFIQTRNEKKIDLNFRELKRKVPSLARNKLNGRQIRNQMWTAGQLAKHRKERLEYTHLEQVIEIANGFEKYLENTHGHTDEENAQAQGTRMSEDDSEMYIRPQSK